jgi:trimethylamine--corrinoid protein Co-methyltransferase
MIYGLGMLETGLTFSYPQLFIDNELARMVKHVVRGIHVDDETLAVDVTRAVGPFGDFMSHDHTLKHMRTVQSRPQLYDREMREDWEKAGAKDVVQRAEEEARKILETYKPEPLPDSVLSTLRSMVDEIEEEYVSKRKRRTKEGSGSA